MKVFNIRDLYNAKYREYILGSAELGKHTVYLVYGETPVNDTREMAPDGHDKILFLLAGEARLESGKEKTAIKKEQAVYLNPQESYRFTAVSNCRYVVAGTHTAQHEH